MAFNQRRGFVIGLLLVASGVGGFFFQQTVDQKWLSLTMSESPVAQDELALKPVDVVQVGDALPDFVLSTLEGEQKTIKAWQGKTLLINFWATWCPPCVREIPLLVEGQKDWLGDQVQVIGIALDKPEKVQAFAEDFQINYPLLVGGMDAIELTRTLGNQYTTLPYTVFVDKNGIVRGVHAGELKKDIIIQQLASHS